MVTITVPLASCQRHMADGKLRPREKRGLSRRDVEVAVGDADPVALMPMHCTDGGTSPIAACTVPRPLLREQAAS
jgi:hypothetical protein